MINADSLEVEVSSIGTIEGEVSASNSIEGELNNTSYTPLIVLQSKTVTPSTSQQNVTFDEGFDGLEKVVVDAVTKSIDSNIKAENIKSGVSILGVDGSLEVGIIPSGKLEITANGTHNVTEYESVEVNVPNIKDTSVEDSIVTRTITSYTNDRIKVIGGHAFRGAGLTSLNCPNVTSIEAYGLDSCSSLVDVNLPKVTSLKNYAMQGCKALARLEFPEKITTQGAVWNNCSSLTTLILRGNTMSGLGNKNCFTNTPIASGTGYIYVPDDLVDAYKANTNWSTYASQIKGLSELS